jgi:hypothetical protein
MGHLFFQTGLGTAVDFVGSLLTIFLVALLIILIVSPFESLQWWAGWVSDDDKDAPAGEPDAAAQLAAGPQRDRYIVFLPGVGAMGTSVDPYEQRLVDRLHGGLHSGVVLTGFFPFTVRDDTLTEERSTAWFWRWLAHVRDTRPSLIARLIDWRNLTQVFVSMDPRYGPIFNKGVEEKIAAVLHEQNYPVGSGIPITLIGYSGGAQVSLGAALYLVHELRAPVTVISLGGVLGDDPALENVEHLYHLFGTNDLEAKLAKAAVPARWQMSKGSRWNRTVAAKRITQTCLGEMVHTGPKGYLDPDTNAPDGRSYLEVTATAMLDIIGSRTATAARDERQIPR